MLVVTGLVGIAALATVDLGTPAHASRGSGKVSQELIATAVAPAFARGRAVVVVKNSDGRLVVVAKKLLRDTTYDLILEGVSIGSLTTTGGGNGKARLRSQPRGRDQFLGTDPRGKTLILRSSGGNDVLVADIPLPTDPTPDDSSDNDIRCCLPDDGGTECEDRTTAQCAAQGGVTMGPGSCLPNPCGGSAGGALDIICCEPDDEGTECEDRTEAECAARGGIHVSATSCTPDPCTPFPPANPDIQCCLPDDGGFECEDRTPETCAAQGGINMGPGTCSPNPCPTGPAPGGDIQCCEPDDGGFECEDRTPAECAARGGTNMGPGTCSPDPCGALGGSGSGSGSGSGNSGPG